MDTRSIDSHQGMKNLRFFAFLFPDSTHSHLTCSNYWWIGMAHEVAILSAQPVIQLQKEDVLTLVGKALH